MRLQGFAHFLNIPSENSNPHTRKSSNNLAFRSLIRTLGFAPDVALKYAITFLFETISNYLFMEIRIV